MVASNNLLYRIGDGENPISRAFELITVSGTVKPDPQYKRESVLAHLVAMGQPEKGFEEILDYIDPETLKPVGGKKQGRAGYYLSVVYEAASQARLQVGDEKPFLSPAITQRIADLAMKRILAKHKADPEPQ